MSAPAGWTEVEGRLMREFSFEDFAGAKAFIDAVSSICEDMNHHAELHFGWSYAVVETMTHDTNSITFILSLIAWTIKSDFRGAWL